MLDQCLQCNPKLHCCINGFTFVGINDAKKIKEFTKKNYNYFLDFSKLNKKTLKLLKNDDPALEGWLRYSLLKKQRILRIRKKNGKCIFLKEGKCQIYEIRPKICKIYPYWCVELIDGSIKVIEHDSKQTCKICNINNLLNKEKKEIKKIFSEIINESEFYKKNIKDFVKENLY